MNSCKVQLLSITLDFQEFNRSIKGGDFMTSQESSEKIHFTI